jgi:hypothetical protein
MSPAVKYTLGRLGLFLVVLAALFPVPLNIFVKLMLALVFSATLSFFLLRTWRDQMAQQLADAAERRRAQKARLRAALAGDDQAPTGTDAPGVGPSGTGPASADPPGEDRGR